MTVAGVLIGAIIVIVSIVGVLTSILGDSNDVDIRDARFQPRSPNQSQQSNSQQGQTNASHRRR